MIGRALNAGKLLVTYAAAFSDPTLISGGAATVETLGSAFEALSRTSADLKTLSRELSKEFAARLASSDIPKDAYPRFETMLLDAGPHMDFAGENLNAETLLATIKGALKDAAYGEGDINRFANLIRPLLETLCNDPRLIAAIQPQIMKTVLEQLALLAGLETRIDELVAKTENQARNFGVKEGMLIALARRYAEGSPDNFEGALSGLEAALEVANAQNIRDAQGSNFEAAVDEIIAQVNALNDAGDIDEADATLDAEIARRAELREQEKAEDKRLLEKAIAQANYTRDAGKLADRALALIRLEQPNAVDQFHALREIWHKRYQDGLRFGTPFALQAAIGLAERCAEIAATPKLRRWALNDLGEALRNTANRAAGAEGEVLFTRTIEAYNAALEQCSKTKTPEDWAMIQQNLAAAHQQLGQRLEGKKALSQCNKAIEGYDNALEVYTKDKTPEDWATVTQNLAISWRYKGTATEGAEGTQALAKAVTLFEDALTVRNEAADPEMWAGTLHNLAGALASQARRADGSEAAPLFEKAQDNWKKAEAFYNKKEYHHDWAETQEDLARLNATWSQHNCCNDPRAHLDAALAHVDNALTKFHPEHSSHHYQKATELRTAIFAILSLIDALPAPSR